MSEFITNLLQQFNERIEEVRSAPPLNDYPGGLTTSHLPIAMTLIASGLTTGLSETWRTEDNYIVTVLVEAINQGDYGENMNLASRLVQAFRSAYFNPDKFESDGTDRKYLSIEPFIEIPLDRPLTIVGPGITVIEHPIGSAPYIGFRLNIPVNQSNIPCED